MKVLLATAGLAAAAMIATPAAAVTWPTYGADTQPGIIITYTDSGISSAATGQGPYDSSEDTYIGVVNNSSHTVNTLNLSSTLNIGGFDSDGIDTFGAPGNSSDTTGYGGPATFFTNNLGTSLTVNFIGGLAPGATTYFSLEEAVSVSQLNPGVPEPATWTLMILGVAGIGYSVRRRRMAATTV